MTYRVSPGVYPNIIDDSLNPTYVNDSIGAIVGAAHRGPLGPTFVSSYPNMTKLYGLTDPTVGYMLDSSAAFLNESTSLWMDRQVSSDSVYGLGLISNNTYQSAPAGTSYTTMPQGSEVPWTDVNREVFDIEFAGPFVSGSSATVTISTNATSSIGFSVDHNTTMGLIAHGVQTVLDNLAVGGLATVISIGTTNNPILRIISPEAITIAVSVAVTGVGAPTATVYEADWLAFVVADNPGAWSTPLLPTTPGIACSIQSVDYGTPQRVTLSFSSAILNGNVITASINGQAITATFDGTTNTNSNMTMAAFCAAYQAAIPGAVATVVNANAGVNGNRMIVLIAPDSATFIDIASIGVNTGTTPYALVTFATTLHAVAATGDFNFAVYESTTFASPTELYTVTYLDGINGLGAPTGFEYVINSGPSKSSRVNVAVNHLFSGTVNGPTVQPALNVECYLGGGADGSLPSTSAIVNGWSDFADPDAITIRILINGGYATPEVHQTMVNLAGKRMDCIAVLDTPSDQQNPSDAANYRNNVMDIDSFWGAIYAPDVLIYDANMGVRRYVPPSGLVACQYAYTDNVAAAWFAPAGLTRGLINTALGLRVTYNEGDRDLMSAAQVNGIRKFGAAFTIWGEYTTQQNMSALQSVPVVRLIIIVVTESVNVTAYSVFEPNNPNTWNKITTVENAVLQPIKDAEGITDFIVQCNANNNTPDIIDQRVCKVALWIKPTLSILYIKLDIIVTRQSATFTVEMQAVNNMY